MKESQQRDVTLRIHESEVGALMKILKFVYNNTLSATMPDLLGVLMAADKFQVTSCMRYCSKLLKEKPMSRESALLYLDLPASVSLGEVVQPLIVAAKEYVVARYSDFNMSKKEVMDLPLCVVEVVLSSNGFQVDSEDDVFDFILEWARAHYPKLEERREILTKHLAPCMYFSHMSCLKLKEVLVCPDFGHEEVSKLVIEALFLKVRVPHLQHIYASKDLATTNLGSLVRVYKLRPIQVVQLQYPQPRCFVFFDLRKDDCKNLFQSTSLFSESFCLGGRWFHLKAECSKNLLQNPFGLYLHMTKVSERCTLDVEFVAIKSSSKEFQNKKKDKANNSTLLLGIGYPDLFGIPWIDFMSNDSDYFIDGILHLRVDLTINNAQYWLLGQNIQPKK